MMLDIGIFVVGWVSGVLSFAIYNTWVDTRAAQAVKAQKKAKSKVAAEKRKATKARKAAAVVPVPVPASESNQTADSSLYGRKANGGATWGT